ncbi:MAG: 50S ribosomal protein L21 [Chlamydiales bacterium]
MTQYAIIQTGGKQYRVKEGDVLDVELIGAEPKQAVEFGEVLLHSDGGKIHVGEPTVQNAVVYGEVVECVRGAKVFAYKYKRRKRSGRRKVGHRQDYTRVKITKLAV